MNQFVESQSTICKINISGFSADNFKTFDPEGYTILCGLGERCDGLSYFPKTSKIILDINNQNHLLNNFDQFIPSIAKDFGIDQTTAIEKSVDFFSDKVVVIQPKGIQGKVYNTMRNLQTYVPMYYTTEAVSILKTTGMTGIKIVTNAPLTFVGATYIGSIFFGYCGSIAGSNPVGSVLNFTSFLLSRPMRGVEIVVNGLFLRPISNAIGLPLLLNGTQEVLSGKGLSIEEWKNINLSFQKIRNSKVFEKATKIYKIIRNKNE